jgi:hypothetical protein
MRNKERLTPLRVTAAAAAAAIALAGYSGVLATKPRVEAPVATAAPTLVHLDPSLAGLRPGPDAEQRGDVHEYY